MIDDHDPLNTVVVIGGGIIGLSTAYYLTKSVPQPNRILLLEKETIACAASGKAGGFIARYTHPRVNKIIVDSENGVGSDEW